MKEKEQRIHHHIEFWSKSRLNLPAMQETLVWFLGREDPLEKGLAIHSSILGLPCGSAGKESACNEGDWGSIPELKRSPGEVKGYPLQYYSLENSKDCNSPWGQKKVVYYWATVTSLHPLQYSGLENSMDCIVNGGARSRTQLSDFHFQT